MVDPVVLGHLSRPSLILIHSQSPETPSGQSRYIYMDLCTPSKGHKDRANPHLHCSSTTALTIIHMAKASPHHPTTIPPQHPEHSRAAKENQAFSGVQRASPGRFIHRLSFQDPAGWRLSHGLGVDSVLGTNTGWAMA